MPAPLELTGYIFGRLTVLCRSGQDAHRAWMWRCRCDCGRIAIVRGSTLAAGRTSACASCAAAKGSATHGMSDTPLYQRWRAMLNRCHLESNTEYRNYGGRGIKVCDQWHDFETFARDMGPTFRPELSIDRIDVDGDYEPGNCRWATWVEQQRNKRTNHLVTWRGRTQTVQDWSEILGIKANTLIYRLRRDWDLDRALTKDARPDVLLELANGGVR